MDNVIAVTSHTNKYNNVFIYCEIFFSPAPLFLRWGNVCNAPMNQSWVLFEVGEKRYVIFPFEMNCRGTKVYLSWTLTLLWSGAKQSGTQTHTHSTSWKWYRLFCDEWYWQAIDSKNEQRLLCFLMAREERDSVFAIGEGCFQLPCSALQVQEPSRGSCL